MKRILTLIVAIIYFTVSSGMVVSVHYCMGKITNTKMQNATKKSCCCKKKQTDNSCCKTEHKLIKLEDNHKAAYANYSFAAPVFYLNNSFIINDVTACMASCKTAFNNHSPPIPSQSVYLLNCVFRI